MLYFHDIKRSGKNKQFGQMFGQPDIQCLRPVMNIRTVTPPFAVVHRFAAV